MSGPGPVGTPLVGGTANRGRVHRVGDTVRRPLRSTAPGVHALLRHLEAVGFAGAPRILGVDGRGREVLSFVPGHAVVAPAPAWALTDDALRSVGRLLRRFHDAAAGFDPAPYHWRHPVPAPFGAGGIAHNDPNLDNIVFRGGLARALIDFDLAAPGAPVFDLAATARMWVPLRDPVDVPDIRAGRTPERLRILVDAYGLDAAGRALFTAAVDAGHDWMCDIVAEGASDGIAGFAAYWTPAAQARADRTRAWLGRESPTLATVVGATHPDR